MSSLRSVTFIFALLFFLFNVNGQVYRTDKLKTTSTSSTTYPVYPTSVFATLHVPGLAPSVFLSPYTQQFTPFYTTVATPQSGSIGLGSITGQVGVVKPPIYVTATSVVT